jgi:hypothetical protein
MKIRFQGCFLYVNDNQILLTHNIYGLIQLNDLVLILTYGFSEKQMDSLSTTNVYAFDEKGKKVWEIKEPFQPPDQTVSYADISLKKTGDVVAGTTQGTEYIVNIKDGSVELIKGQRPW